MSLLDVAADSGLVLRCHRERSEQSRIDDFAPFFPVLQRLAILALERFLSRLFVAPAFRPAYLCPWQIPVARFIRAKYSFPPARSCRRAAGDLLKEDNQNCISATFPPCFSAPCSSPSSSPASSNPPPKNASSPPSATSSFSWFSPSPSPGSCISSPTSTAFVSRPPALAGRRLSASAPALALIFAGWPILCRLRKGWGLVRVAQTLRAFRRSVAFALRVFCSGGFIPPFVALSFRACPPRRAGRRGCDQYPTRNLQLFFAR
jgi:hypothetical protein